MNILRTCKRTIKHITPHGLLLVIGELNQYIQAAYERKLGHWAIPQKRHEECIIIASGPSVAENESELIKYAANRDVFTVNSVVSTQIFSKTNPYIHILADPEYFNSNPTKYVRQFQNEAYSKLNSLEDQALLAVPHKYYSQACEFITNEKITLFSFPRKNVKSVNTWTNYQLRSGLKCFGLSTVPIGALYLALMMNYTRISFIGFDLSTKYRVNERCQVIADLDHYYDANIEVSNDYFKNCHFIPGVNVHEELLVAKHYAIDNNIEIVNLSINSMIDIFPKSNFCGEVFPFKADG